MPPKVLNLALSDIREKLGDVRTRLQREETRLLKDTHEWHSLRRQHSRQRQPVDLDDDFEDEAPGPNPAESPAAVAAAADRQASLRKIRTRLDDTASCFLILDWFPPRVRHQEGLPELLAELREYTEALAEQPPDACSVEYVETVLIQIDAFLRQGDSAPIRTNSSFDCPLEKYL